MPAISYQVEAFDQVWPEAQALLQLHWQEIARDKETIPLAPLVEQYQAADRQRTLLIVTARSGGVLVGYYVAFIRPHLHYGTSLTLFTDIFFIHPDYRRGRAAVGLFNLVEQEARARGVQRMFSTCKLAHDLKPLFDHMNWTEIERVFSKTLES